VTGGDGVAVLAPLLAVELMGTTEESFQAHEGGGDLVAEERGGRDDGAAGGDEAAEEEGFQVGGELVLAHLASQYDGEGEAEAADDGAEDEDDDELLVGVERAGEGVLREAADRSRSRS